MCLQKLNQPFSRVIRAGDAQANGVDERLGQEGRFFCPVQLVKENTIGNGVRFRGMFRDLGRRLERQPGFANPALPGECQQVAVGLAEQFYHFINRAFAAD